MIPESSTRKAQQRSLVFLSNFTHVRQYLITGLKKTAHASITTLCVV
jgi:hypothetical protein